MKTCQYLLLLSFCGLSGAFSPTVHHSGSTFSTRNTLASSKDARSLDSFDIDTSFFTSEQSNQLSSRRGIFQKLAVFVTSAVLLPSDVSATSEKILVLGGSGFVGSRVVETLQSLNVDVVATSRDGRDATVACDINDSEKIKKLASGCSAVISCVGVIGTENDRLINAGTAKAAAAAKAAGVERFVYITVAPEVKDFAKDIEFLKGYMEGKSESREAVLSLFGDKATLIEPTFIYGGGSFELNPPRVASFYGKFIEGLLASGPIRALEGVTPAGIIKIALEPPVPVEAVARAAVAGAFGKTLMVLDTYDKIKNAAKLSDTLQGL